MKADVTGLCNSNLRVIAAKEVLLELVHRFYGTIGISEYFAKQQSCSFKRRTFRQSRAVRGHM